MPRRIFVCLPAGRTQALLSRAEHLRVERLVAGHLSAILDNAVIVRRLVLKPEYNSCTREVVAANGSAGAGRCFVRLVLERAIVNIACVNLLDFTGGNVMLVNDATTLRQYYTPGDMVEWFCPDCMDLQDAAGATERRLLWPGGLVVSAAAHRAHWGHQRDYAKSALIARWTDFAVVKHPTGCFLWYLQGATEAQHQEFVGATFDFHESANSGVPP